MTEALKDEIQHVWITLEKDVPRENYTRDKMGENYTIDKDQEMD